MFSAPSWLSDDLVCALRKDVVGVFARDVVGGTANLAVFTAAKRAQEIEDEYEVTRVAQERLARQVELLLRSLHSERNAVRVRCHLSDLHGSLRHISEVPSVAAWVEAAGGSADGIAAGAGTSSMAERRWRAGGCVQGSH